jgi:hypothetical protein
MKSVLPMRATSPMKRSGQAGRFEVDEVLDPNRGARNGRNLNPLRLYIARINFKSLYFKVNIICYKVISNIKNVILL